MDGATKGVWRVGVAAAEKKAQEASMATRRRKTEAIDPSKMTVADGFGDMVIGEWNELHRVLYGLRPQPIPRSE